MRSPRKRAIKRVCVCVILCFLSLFAESASSVKTKCIQVDFGGGLDIYDTISSELAGLEIGLLGNCCSMLLFTVLVSSVWFGP